MSRREKHPRIRRLLITKINPKFSKELRNVSHQSIPYIPNLRGVKKIRENGQ